MIRDFSLFFFSADGSVAAADKYDLLLECARFADRHGFKAVWTPERHFQDFGGLYPNPSVLGAALATITESVEIRAGSVVVPLHHPVRIAEEWAVVDNLSGGRVGLALASGWHPQDFVLSSVPHAERRRYLGRHVQTIRDLWAGKVVRFHDRDGAAHDLRIRPRPLQPTLPLWIAIAGNQDTWDLAGAVGANVLTALGIVSFDDLKAKIDRYRATLSAHGHDPSAQTVTVMVHTHLGASDERVKAAVREPMTRYLDGFLKQTESAAGTARDFSAYDVSDTDRRDLLAIAFERYFDRMALFGTPERCAALVARLAAVDVDEIACLVDFGLSAEATLAGLTHLDTLRRAHVV